MKKIIFLFLLGLSTATVTNAQFLDKLKSKTKVAANNSVDRSSDKVVDKAVNQPADKVTDQVLNKTGEKINGLFKKKNKNKRAQSTESPVAVQDSIITKPETQN